MNLKKFSIHKIYLRNCSNVQVLVQVKILHYRGASVLFASPKHMKYFRLKMMWEIINSKLLFVDHRQSLRTVVRSKGNGIKT